MVLQLSTRSILGDRVDPALLSYREEMMALGEFSKNQLGLGTAHSAVARELAISLDWSEPFNHRAVVEQATIAVAAGIPSIRGRRSLAEFDRIAAKLS